jgi:broad specificity phosphatase PhoE
MIILIRHAQSEGNKNREIHQSVPDHRVKLTPEGHKQALEAGRRLRTLLRPDDTLHFFTSPYRRTRETTEGILNSLTSDDPSPSPFPRHTIKVYEEPRLREQDFGNFQPCSAEMERMWQERADYGHFFYRIPNGESAADAYDRVSGFNESLWRLFGEDDFASVCILVTHGLMTRIFLMKWYHFSVEYFEDLRNVNHCEFVIMEKNPDNGKYILQTKLRTWSELRKERELEGKREQAVKGIPDWVIAPSEPPPTRRKWGGCPDGCSHSAGPARSKTWRPARQDKVDLFRDDDGGETSDGHAGAAQQSDLSSAEGSLSAKRGMARNKPKTHLSITAHRHESIDEIISSPAQTPSYISLASLSAPRANSSPAVYSAARPTERAARQPSVRDKLPSVSPLRLSTDDDDGDSDNRGPPPPPPPGPGSGPRVSTGLKTTREPTDDEEVDSLLPELHQPLQDAEDDGDDEGSGTRRRTIRRPKQPHHHHSHHHPNTNNNSNNKDNNPRSTSRTNSKQQQQPPPPSGLRIENYLPGDKNDDEEDDEDSANSASDFHDDEEEEDIADTESGRGGGRERRNSVDSERERDQSIRGSVY